jgi:hypothetical protein
VSSHYAYPGGLSQFVIVSAVISQAKAGMLQTQCVPQACAGLHAVLHGLPQTHTHCHSGWHLTQCSTCCRPSHYPALQTCSDTHTPLRHLVGAGWLLPRHLGPLLLLTRHKVRRVDVQQVPGPALRVGALAGDVWQAGVTPKGLTPSTQLTSNHKAYGSRRPAAGAGFKAAA